MKLVLYRSSCMASSIRISWGRYTDIEKCSQDFIQLVKKAEMLVKYGLND